MHVPALTRLKHLSLRGGSLDDDQLGFLNDLPALRRLDLFQLPITGVGFGKVRETCRLRYVQIGRCPEFGEEGLEQLLRFRDLERVYLAETGVKTRPGRVVIEKKR